MSIILTFNSDPETYQQPWPVAIDGNNDVTSGLGPNDGARLIGFGPVGEQRLTVTVQDAIDAKGENIIGLAPSFSDGKGFFEWPFPINGVTFQ